jgi:small-conductance mechanosensitive channel
MPLALLLQAETPLLEYFTPTSVLLVLLILAATGLLIRYMSYLFGLVSARSTEARFFFRWVEPVFRISLWFLAIFLSIDVIAPTKETFIAAVGSAAIAVALGAQDLIKNLIGGLVVLTDRPYQLGDRVRIGDAYGEIDHIGLRSTKLTTPDDTRVTIPNATILSEQVYNANSGVPDCQVVTDLFLPCNTDADLVIRIGYEAAYTCPFTYLAKPIVVLVAHGFERTPYLRLRVKAYVFDHRYESRMQSDITARAQKEFRNLGLLDEWPATSVSRKSRPE